MLLSQDPKLKQILDFGLLKQLNITGKDLDELTLLAELDEMIQLVREGDFQKVGHVCVCVLGLGRGRERAAVGESGDERRAVRA